MPVSVKTIFIYRAQSTLATQKPCEEEENCFFFSPKKHFSAVFVCIVAVVLFVEKSILMNVKILWYYIFLLCVYCK